MGQNQTPDTTELTDGWEDVPEAARTQRLRVPGGWLYKHHAPYFGGAALTMCFVPDYQMGHPTPHDAGYTEENPDAQTT